MPQPKHDPNLLARIENDFRYHPPTPDQVPLYNEVRERAKHFALFLEENVPHGRELSTALTQLEACVMNANAGIARSGGT